MNLTLIAFSIILVALLFIGGWYIDRETQLPARPRERRHQGAERRT